MIEPRDIVDSDKWHEVLLMTEDKVLQLTIGFYGYTEEKITAYIQDKFAKSKRWTKFKLLK